MDDAHEDAQRADAVRELGAILAGHGHRVLGGGLVVAPLGEVLVDGQLLPEGLELLGPQLGGLAGLLLGGDLLDLRVLLGRLLRVFRVLRLVSVVPELRFLINSRYCASF